VKAGRSADPARFKPSIYNHRTALPDGDVLYFNFYTLNLIALRSDQAARADRYLREPGGWGGKRVPGIARLLIDKGFLVDARIDETETLLDSFDKARAHRGGLGLTLLPTLACNFRCVYCYETHRARSMTPEVEAAVLGLVEERLPPGEKLSVTWFGGEPLLGLDIIERLSEGFLRICHDRKSAYSASMISNGYLLTGKVAKRLDGIGVKRVQVTLDGPPDIHDARRPKAGGGGTFETILANLKEASSILTINLRINVDSSNRDSIPRLLEVLVREGLESSVFPYLGHTKPYTEVCQDVAEICLSDADFALLELETGLEMIKRGLGGFTVPQSRDLYCMADRPNSWVISPDGGVAKCWNDASDPDREVGHLLRATTPRMEENARLWTARDPRKLECRTCPLLPICAGGCPYFFTRFNTLDCHGWKHHLDESIAFYYLLKKMESVGEIGEKFYEIVDEVKKLRPDVLDKSGPPDPDERRPLEKRRS